MNPGIKTIKSIMQLFFSYMYIFYYLLSHLLEIIYMYTLYIIIILLLLHYGHINCHVYMISCFKLFRIILILLLAMQSVLSSILPLSMLFHSRAPISNGYRNKTFAVQERRHYKWLRCRASTRRI